MASFSMYDPGVLKTDLERITFHAELDGFMQTVDGDGLMYSRKDSVAC